MRNKFVPAGLLLTAAAIVLAAVAFSPTAHSAPQSVQSFQAMLNRGVDVDYTPLASPADAIAKGHLAVEGTLTGVVDGVSLQFPSPALTERYANTYATLVVSVARVIDGNPADVRAGKVYVQVSKSKAVTVQQLAAANPNPRVVAVLDNITSWVPAPGVQVRRPSALPAAVPLFAAYTDGLWLQGPADPAMYGLGAQPGELAAAWGKPTTVTQFATALAGAAG
jgi:hypothetical protein